MTTDEAVESARALAREHLARRGSTPVAAEVGVSVKSLTDFAQGHIAQPRAANWTKIREWAERYRTDVGTAALPDPPAGLGTEFRLASEFQLGAIAGNARSVLRLLDMARQEQLNLIGGLEQVGRQVILGGSTAERPASAPATLPGPVSADTLRELDGLAEAEAAADAEDAKQRPYLSVGPLKPPVAI